MKYRPEIDGLRTLAVIPVILFHLNFKIVSGGYVGVDIFFVISGFLISTIIFEEIENNKFTLSHFYERRARRILPALFFTLIISSIFSWILLQPFEFLKFHKSLLSVLTFSSNIFFWRDGDYFVTDSSLKPLLHTWSLAIEEQFYLFFPLLLIFIKNLNKKLIFLILLFVTLGSLTLSQIGSIYFKTPNFYLLPTRFWELSLGTLAALKIKDLNKLFNSLWNELLGFLGLALILFSIFKFDEFTPFPSFYTLLPTCGTALVIIFISNNNKIGFILTNKIMVNIGLLSYSAYLFHQPLISFVKIYLEHDLTFENKIIILVTTLLLSYFSYRFVEFPFKNKIRFPRITIFWISTLAGITIIFYSIFVFKFMNFPYEKDLAKKLSISKAITTTNMDERKFTKYRIEYLNTSPDTLVLGSSRIMQVSGRSGKVLNLSVSGATVEDQITFAILALQKFIPKVVFIAADPWLFNENSGQNRWRTINDDYNEALRIISSSNITKANFEKISNIDTFQQEFNFYKKINIKYSKIGSTDEKPGMYDKIRNDGSRIYNTTYANLKPYEIQKGFNNLIEYSMTDWKFSPQYFRNFDKLINYLNNKKVKVVLVLSPYHPVLYHEISNNKYKFNIAEEIFYNLAKKKAIQIIGSYDPNKCGCKSFDFYDGMHPKDFCMYKLIASTSN